MSLRAFGVYIAVAVCVAVGLIEIYGRFFADPTDVEKELAFFIPDASLGWANRPGVDRVFYSEKYGYHGRVHFDERGLRPTENELASPRDLRPPLTLLLIGDSTTTGMEVDNNQTFGAELERLLKKSGRNVRVLNAGVRGYGADQSLIRLKQLLTTVHPDLVLFMASRYGIQQLNSMKNWYRHFSKPAFAIDGERLRLLNSPVQSMDEEEYAYLVYHGDKYEVIRGRAKPSGLARFFRAHSYLYSQLDNLYYAKHMSQNAKAPSKIDDRKLETLEKIILEMKRLSPRFMMTAFTVVKGGPVPEYSLFKSLAEKNDVVFLDIQPYFKSRINYVFGNDGHWNTTGHEQGGQALYQELLSRLARGQ